MGAVSFGNKLTFLIDLAESDSFRYLVFASQPFVNSTRNLDLSFDEPHGLKSMAKLVPVP